MPYRLDPTNSGCVQVNKNGTWERVKCHDTEEKAAAHLTALKSNVHKRITADIAKLDEDRMIAFGWASVVKKDGVPVVDSQDDIMDEYALEESVYDYVLISRDADEMHQKRGVGRLVESMYFTEEKIEKLGLPPGSLPTGWWVGFKVDNPDVWAKVKSGEYRMFSIFGRGRREPVNA